MDAEVAANFYAEDAAELLAQANSYDRWFAWGDTPQEWIEEQVASQLSNANAARGFKR